MPAWFHTYRCLSVRIQEGLDLMTQRRVAATGAVLIGTTFLGPADLQRRGKEA